MSDYGIFFDYNNITYRLPVNPEEIEVSSTQAIEKYEILKLGQIAIPTHMELKTYSFECELPHDRLHYVETSGGFKDADFYLDLFKKWREEMTPVRFIVYSNSFNINSLVLIEELTITEKAGEEGDKYVSFKLVEYRNYAKRPPYVVKQTSPTTAVVVNENTSPEESNPKCNDTYIVQPSDTLWFIAKLYYGDGAKYTKIFEANKDLIKNPSLIYPGQKLVIPL